MEKFLFLYLKTGGGHYSSAKTVAEFILQQTENIQIELIDGLAESPRWLKKLLESGYSYAQKSARWIYSLMYFLHTNKWIASLTLTLIGFFVKPYLRYQIIKHKPTKIVSYHFFLVKPIQEILKGDKLSHISFEVIVTDPFTAPPIWFNCPNVSYVVFSESAKQIAQNLGVKEENIQVMPYIFNQKFNTILAEEQRVSQKIARGFRLHKNTVLILGGGDGLKNASVLVEKLHAYEHLEIAVVCGKNQKMFDKLTELQHKLDIDNLKIYGFVDFVYELINISDVVLSKGGPASVMEVLSQKKPLILVDYIWGQEKGNVDFVVQNNLGVFTRNADTIANYLSDMNLLNNIASSLELTKIINGTQMLAKHIIGNPLEKIHTTPDKTASINLKQTPA